MRTSTTILPAIRVEYRAASLEEIQQIDLDVPEPVLPAFVFLQRERWRKAMSPFLRERTGRNPSGPERWGPPGAAIWAQLASRTGDVIVGGRDGAGLPCVPVAAPNGDIHFLPAHPAPGFGDSDTPSGWIELPVPTPADSDADDKRSCRPILSSAGPITCGLPGCHDCLDMTQRSSCIPWWPACARTPPSSAGPLPTRP